MASTLAPAYVDDYHRTTSRSGALIRQPPLVDDPVIHHHLHHHIDHGDVSSRNLALSHSHNHRRSLGREYSYDDLDVREHRHPNGVAVSQIHHSHDHRHRHRHRYRSGGRRFSRSDIDLPHRHMDDHHFHDDYTVVDVPPGSRRVYLNMDKGMRRDIDIDWRREHGVRRSRGLGNELWTEITKDLVTREAIEEMGYQYEETDFFYYIFEYLDREEIQELREITEDIRRERVRDIEYESIAGSGPRMINNRADFDDARTEIIIENGRSGRSRRSKYYY